MERMTPERLATLEDAAREWIRGPQIDGATWAATVLNLVDEVRALTNELLTYEDTAVETRASVLEAAIREALESLECLCPDGVTAASVLREALG